MLKVTEEVLQGVSVSRSVDKCQDDSLLAASRRWRSAYHQYRASNKYVTDSSIPRTFHALVAVSTELNIGATQEWNPGQPLFDNESLSSEYQFICGQ